MSIPYNPQNSAPSTVQPKVITSPFSGEPVRPQIRMREAGNKIYKEAHWYCPSSGRFIQKGIVSIEDKK